MFSVHGGYQRHHCHHNKRKSTNSSFWRSTAFRLKKLVLQMRKSSSTRRRTRLPAWYGTTFSFPLRITVVSINHKRSARDQPQVRQNRTFNCLPPWHHHHQYNTHHGGNNLPEGNTTSCHVSAVEHSREPSLKMIWYGSVSAGQEKTW